MASGMPQHPRACHSPAAGLLSSPLHTIVDGSPFSCHCHTLDSSTPPPAFSVVSFVAPAFGEAHAIPWRQFCLTHR